MRVHTNMIHHLKFWHREQNGSQFFLEGSQNLGGKMTYSELREKSKHSWQITGCKRVSKILGY